jgi:hypothetical protein
MMPTKQTVLNACISLWVLVLGFVAALASAAPFLPAFSAAAFVPGAPINHPYFPLPLDNKTRTYKGAGATATERFEFTPMGAGPTILGVQTTARRDRAFDGALLIEETLDYFAQDKVGNVWYFGEDVTNFVYDAAGKLLSTNSKSAWRAGVSGAQPGFFIPADLTKGFNYYQEFAATDQALDQGTTFAVGGSVSIGASKFADVLQVLETTELDPAAREFKYYARGEGLVKAEEGLDANFANPAGGFELVSTSATPTTTTSGGGGGGCVMTADHRFDPALSAAVVAALLWMGRRRRFDRK